MGPVVILPSSNHVLALLLEAVPSVVGLQPVPAPACCPVTSPVSLGSGTGGNPARRPQLCGVVCRRASSHQAVTHTREEPHLPPCCPHFLDVVPHPSR
ncbi:hypothetical protein QBC39DRAFT_346900 [Podospora conica]|nr:hypothetical protein QBC39DRAFT_346900 [Schizothecium conicum]